MTKEEWEAWLALPATVEYRQLLKDKAQEFDADIDPRGVDAQTFHAVCVEAVSKAEAYTLIYESLDVEFYEDIFGEEHE